MGSSLGSVLVGFNGARLAAARLAAGLTQEQLGAAIGSVQDADRPTPPLAVPPKRLHIGPADGYLPCRSVASATAGTMGGIAADAPTVARWGYQLYGARAVPSQTAQMMITAPTPEEIFPLIQYGLGTMIFSTLQLHVRPSAVTPGTTQRAPRCSP
jgi:D-alanyl-D-alanine carboxypeptidase